VVELKANDLHVRVLTGAARHDLTLALNQVISVHVKPDDISKVTTAIDKLIRAHLTALDQLKEKNHGMG